MAQIPEQAAISSVHRLRRKGNFYEQTSFILVDLFTTRHLGSNPLAIFPDGSINPETMHAIAKAFHFSETIFVLPPEDRRTAYRLRIFTPGTKLPMSGHTTNALSMEVSLRDKGRTYMNILQEIGQAELRIRPYILKTPLFYSHFLSVETQSKVYFKLESEQYTGSFKLRGATNKVLSLTEEEKQQAVMTASSGNHGQALAMALQVSGARGMVVVPEHADPSKVEAIKRYGAAVEVYGKNALEAELYAKQRAQERGMIWVSPYNDPHIVAGQGTIGLELAEQLNVIDALFVTIGGGGLMSGIGTYMRAVSPETKMVGCLPENAAEMYESIKTGQFVASAHKETISDGSAGGVEAGSITYAICKEVVDEYVLVSEDEIKHAIRLMVNMHHKIIEGAAGVAVASFFKHKDQYQGKNVVIVICGANIATEKLRAIL